jgi:hypothetical protein
MLTNDAKTTRPRWANLSGIKFATSIFQHDDSVTLNAQGHGHNFIDTM